MHFCPPNARKWIKKLLQQKEEEMRPGGREGCFFQTSAKHPWRTERRPRFCWLFFFWNSKGISKANDQTNWRGYIHDTYCWRTFKFKKRSGTSQKLWEQPYTSVELSWLEEESFPTLRMATRGPQGMESLHHQAWWLEDMTPVLVQYSRNPGNLAEEGIHSITSRSR